MTDRKKVLAIIGSYRKGGVIDKAVDEILFSAGEAGAETGKIYLIDRHIEFCSNCRTCTQHPGTERGRCITEDDMDGILDELQAADAIILGSPMNFGTVTAVMKKIIERLVCFAYWPWGMNAPRIRTDIKPKYAVVVASSAAPSLIARLSSNMVKLLKNAAGLLGARTIGVLFIGLAAGKKQQDIGDRTKRTARRLGRQLAVKIGAGRA